MIKSIRRAPADFELVCEDDIWVATHVETGVASQGESPNEAVALHLEAHHPSDDEYQTEMLERFDIDEESTEESIDSPGGMP